MTIQRQDHFRVDLHEQDGTWWAEATDTSYARMEFADLRCCAAGHADLDAARQHGLEAVADPNRRAAAEPSRGVNYNL